MTGWRILPVGLARTGAVMRISRQQEEKLPIRPKYTLRNGGVYVVFEKGHDIGFDILFNVLKSSPEFDYGLCFTRENPERIRRKYDLKNTSFVWLTRRRGDNNIPPESLNRIAGLVSEFVGERSMVYIDGIEYLIASNDFDAVRTLLDHLSDVITTSGGVLVYSVDPDILDDRERAILERFAEVIAP